MTKYEKLAQDLIERISNNEFDETQKLPTEEELVEYYHVSRNTVRSAIKTLIHVGKVYVRQGSGIFIRKQPKDALLLSSTNGLVHDFPNNVFETRVISLKLLNADEDLANKMLCEIGTPIYYIERLRMIDGKKFALELTHYNKNIVKYLDEHIASKSIYSYLKNDINLKFGFADKYVKVIKSTKLQSQYLDLEEGDPLLVISDNVYLESGELFNVSQMLYNYKYALFYTPSIN